MPDLFKRCNNPRCRTRIPSGQRLCDDCFNERKQQFDMRRGSAASRGYGRAWQRIRSAQVHAQPLCEVCSALGRVEPTAEVHHVIPLFAGGSNVRSNLVSLCIEHHNLTRRRRQPRGVYNSQTFIAWFAKLESRFAEYGKTSQGG